MNGRLTLAASLGLLLFAGTVSAAQPWLQDRRYGEGVGIQAGRFELHPGVSTEFGYDSNFFQRADSENPADAWRLRVTPSLSLNTLRERKRGSTQEKGEDPTVVINANTFLAYSEIFGSDEVNDQRNFDAGIGGKLDFSPTRPLGADIYADFLRNGEPSNAAGTGQTFDRGTVRGGAGVNWRPGGGLFDWRVGYEASYAYFEDQPYDGYDNVQHSILTRGRWRILPRSGFIYDARYTFIRYEAGSPQPSGDYVQARLGFSGLVTSRVAFLVLGGWNSTFYEASTAANVPAENYDGYVGQAELRFFLMDRDSDSAETGLSSITVGFTRDLNNSYLGAFYTRDRGYLGVDAFLAGAFVASLQGGFARYSYPRIDNTLNPLGFTQNHIDAQAFAEYRFNDILGLNFTVTYDQAIGEGPYPDGVMIDDGTATGIPLYDNLEYRRVQAYLGLRLFW